MKLLPILLTHLHMDTFLGRKSRTVPGNHLTGIQQWFKGLSIDFCKSLPYFMTSLFSIERKIFPLTKKKSLTSSRAGFVIKDSEQGTNSTTLRGLLGIKRRYVVTCTQHLACSERSGHRCVRSNSDVTAKQLTTYMLLRQVQP